MSENHECLWARAGVGCVDHWRSDKQDWIGEFICKTKTKKGKSPRQNLVQPSWEQQLGGILQERRAASHLFFLKFLFGSLCRWRKGSLCLWGDLRGAVDIIITPLLSALSYIILPGHHGNTPRWHYVLREEEGFCRLDWLSVSNEIQSIFWSIFNHTFLYCQV